jgi:hypothetical protein
MRHVCVAARIVDDAKGGAVDIANIDKPPDKVRRDPGRNPQGWHEFSPMALSLTLPISTYWLRIASRPERKS